jgi:hypothetical protein
MADGVEVIKQAIARDFGSVRIDEGENFDTKGTILRFTSEGRAFVVEVSYEFDADYSSGQVRIDLHQLGAVLRGSKDGRADVTRSGISLRSAA